VRRRGSAQTVVLVVLALLGAFAVAMTHMRTKSGRKTLAGVHGCWTCHFVSTSRLPWTHERPHHAAPAGLAVSHDGARAFVALDDTNEVAEVELAERRVLRKARVAGAPTGLALDGSGQTLFVTCRGGDRVAALDARTLEEKGSVSVGTGPIGVAAVVTPLGERLVVANAISDDVSVVALDPLREVARLVAGREPYAVAAGPAGRAFVVARMSGICRGDEIPASEVTVVDAAAGRLDRRLGLPSAHLSEGIAPLPGGARALASIVRVRNLVPITQVAQGWVMSSGVALCDAASGSVVEVPLDEANAYYADPSGVAVDAAGRRAYVASAGGDAVSVVDLERLGGWLSAASEGERSEAIDDLQLSGTYVLARVPTGRNPRQVALTPDGKTLVVAERLDDSLLLVDTATLRPLGRVALGDGGKGDPIRRGEVVFARATTTFQAQFSCRSCHPDGHVDGLTYDFDIDGVGRDILDNRSLQGIAGTEPFKWNGKNPTLQVQCGPRFAKVLTRAAPFPKPDLDDLDTFLRSLPPTRTGHEPKGSLSEVQERGRQLFFATRSTDGREIPYSLRCSTCHRPPLYTDRLPADVGTKGATDSSGTFDTPHLLGIAASAPYLHDGRAATLEEIWTVYNPHDTHGITNYMTKHQLNDLIEYLKTL
jgi:DNA-binding beta-propeller fold protein YncE